MTSTKMDLNKRQEFLGALMLWCFRWGCEVQLRNIAAYRPVMDPTNPNAFGDSHERGPNGDLVDMVHRTNHQVIEIPELVFTRNEKKVSMTAHNWEDLMRAVEHQHRSIYMELSVPMFTWRSA